ncbi:hypothetical protein HYV86_06415 [Candidatus Woesearchaeota archaeon]|nr:hypothetical protein [Candidatus Woesearchaeota archaeon]
MNEKWRFGAFIGVIGAFLLLFYLDLFSESPSSVGGDSSFIFSSYHPYIMVLLSVLAIILGAWMYSTLNVEIDSQKKTMGESIHTLLPLLDNSQRKILIFLAQKNSSVLQKELSYIEGMDKLKVHRALRSLQGTGAVIIEKHGKINKIHLKKEVQEVLNGVVL